MIRSLMDPWFSRLTLHNIFSRWAFKKIGNSLNIYILYILQPIDQQGSSLVEFWEQNLWLVLVEWWTLVDLRVDQSSCSLGRRTLATINRSADMIIYINNTLTMMGDFNLEESKSTINLRVLRGAYSFLAVFYRRALRKTSGWNNSLSVSGSLKMVLFWILSNHLFKAMHFLQNAFNHAVTESGPSHKLLHMGGTWSLMKIKPISMMSVVSRPLDSRTDFKESKMCSIFSNWCWHYCTSK